MTLNDNPRVIAEHRLKLMRARMDRVNDACRRMVPEYGPDGFVARLWWTGVPGAKTAKGNRLRSKMWAEIKSLEKFINSFK